jgi:hypothetical protein
VVLLIFYNRNITIIKLLPQEVGKKKFYGRSSREGQRAGLNFTLPYFDGRMCIFALFHARGKVRKIFPPGIFHAAGCFPFV